MTDGPGLADLLQISAAAGACIGAFIGLLLDAPTGRAIIDNALRWSTLGGIVGLSIGFALAAAIALDGA